MGNTNFGTQKINVNYFDPVDDVVVNDRLLGLQPRGIYSGGYLTKVNDTTVTISPLACEIGDADHQLRISTSASQNITVSTTLTYVVLRWVYSEVVDNYMDMLAVSSPSTNDLVIGKCSFSGATLQGFDYTLRTNPIILSKNLLIESTETPSMYVRVRGGKISNGSGVIDVVDQISPIFTAPVSNSRIDAIVCDSTGVISIIQGNAAVTPNAPDYAGKLGLAEVTLTSSSTTITNSMIRNVANANPAGAAYKAYVDARTIKTIVFTNAYAMIVGSSPFKIRFPMAGTITGVYGYVGTAPTGANAIIDINVDGTSIWNSGANRFTIMAGNTSANQTTINNPTITAGQVVTMDIDQIGSSVAGSDLTININVAV